MSITLCVLETLVAQISLRVKVPKPFKEPQPFIEGTNSWIMNTSYTPYYNVMRLMHQFDALNLSGYGERQIIPLETYDIIGLFPGF